MIGLYAPTRATKGRNSSRRLEIVQIKQTRTITALVDPWCEHPSMLEATCVDEVESTRFAANPYMTACDSIVETMLNPGATDENFKICQEMYSTERNYIEKLKLLLKVKDALLERVAKNKPVMKEATIKQIFGKIKPIVEIHERICSELKDLMDNFDEKGRHIAEIWKNVSYELLRIYPAYTNYCDMARLMFVSECEKNAKLRSFIEELEKDPAFNRQKIADIMVIPVQRLAGVKLLLEKLQKKSARRQRVAIQSAIDKVSDVLSQSNTIRMNSDKYMASLSLFAQVDSIPVKLVKSSNDMIISVDGRLLCGTEKLDIKDNTKIKLVLFKDATVLVCKKARSLGEKTWLGKAVWRKTFLSSFKKPYKYIMSLKAEQFREIIFIFCHKFLKDGNAPLERTPFCCWRIREERSDIDWFVEVDGTQMELFSQHLFAALPSRVDITSRWLRHNGMMTFAEVPTECQAILKRELTEKGYITEELDEVSTPVRNGVKHMAQMFGLGNMSEVFHSRSTTVKKAKIDGHLTLHFQSNLEDPPGFGHLNSTPVRRRLVYPAE
ncbi:hypothetical protein Q1695_011926 [Nippostrongylus brasiliensis]|nr:hypothetical protein Q1695_011926 [Nippostrongylus brasiliensis]